MWQRWAGGGENERRSRQAAGRLMSGAGRLMPVRGSADSRVCREHADESLREVALTAAAVENWEEYGTVFIGYPIWWGIAAWPVDGFVTGNDFTGKTVIPFCTSASSPLGQSGELLAKLAGTGDWQGGHRFGSSAAQSEVAAWAEGLGISG